MRDYKAYLFDVDGTLLDTTELIYRCFVYTCGRFGDKEVSRDEVVANIGLTLRRQMEVYFGPLTEERYRPMAEAHMEYQLSIYSRYLKVFPGVAETLEELKTRGGRLAVVTSRRRKTLTRYLDETGLLGLFDHLVSPELTAKAKPDPEPANKALSLLGGIGPQEALFIGDSTFDMGCGSAAGTDTAFVLWSHTDAEGLPVRPTWLIGNMADLLGGQDAKG